MAHQDLIRLGEPIPENKKVRDFLNGIQDPQCATIKLTVLANNLYINNFAQAVNYIAGAIDLITKNTSTSARQISDITCNDGFYNQGRGKARSRGGHFPGRGRGCGRIGRR